MGENEAFCHLSSLLVQKTKALPPKFNMCIFLFSNLNVIELDLVTAFILMLYCYLQQNATIP